MREGEMPEEEGGRERNQEDVGGKVRDAEARGGAPMGVRIDREEDGLGVPPRQLPHAPLHPLARPADRSSSVLVCARARMYVSAFKLAHEHAIDQPAYPHQRTRVTRPHARLPARPHACPHARTPARPPARPSARPPARTHARGADLQKGA